MILSVMTIILLPIALLLLLLIFITLNRYIRYRERVALAQLGYGIHPDRLRAKPQRVHGVVYRLDVDLGFARELPRVKSHLTLAEQREGLL